MGAKKRNAIEWAMHYRQIIILVVSCLVAFGIYGLVEMKKNEFPDFTIRQGIVVAVYPGATSEEIEEQVAKPLENFIFGYKEVKKSKTFSQCRDGVVYIQVQLNDELNNKDEFWSKFKHGVNDFKGELPKGVIAVQVIDDFGDTSALLITMESKNKTYRELKTYMDGLKDQLRKVESVGTLRVSGLQQEQISIYLDNKKMSQYGINDKMLATTLFTKGFTTASGRLKIKESKYISPIYVGKSLNTLRSVQEMIVYSDVHGNNIRLKDVAKVVKEYPDCDSYIKSNGKKCILLSLEMKKGKNILKMGEAVNKVLDEYGKTLPSDVSLFRITDQCKVVSDSVNTFIHELGIAIIAVILVVVLLLPFRVAMIAASTIPITIFISLGLFNVFGIELNTVTLAALIATLGMIVDNSIVIIDSYIEKLGEGISRWHAAIDSGAHFFKSILSATMAISITFFPFLFTMTGMNHDFLLSFPWAMTLILLISLLIAELLVPFMQFFFIRKPIQSELPINGKRKFSFLDFIQNGYDWLLNKCFSYPRTTIGFGVISVVLGIWLMGKVPQRLMPNADRNQFAVEIYMPTGTAVEKTALIADSLENLLKKDNRIVSVTSFIGMSSPRFQNSYAPKIPGTNYAQFIVNTKSISDTEDILDEYTPRYANYFPEAVVRFKQLNYSEAINPIEVRISGDSLSLLKKEADRVVSILRSIPETNQVRTDYNEPLAASRIQLDEDESIRMGITNAMLEVTMAMRYSNGVPLATVWEGDYGIDVVMKSVNSDSANYDNIKDEMIPAAAGLVNVPIRQIAKVVPTWHQGQIVRRNGVRTMTVMSEVKRGENIMAVTHKIKNEIEKSKLPDGVNINYGGEYEESQEQAPNIIAALIIAIIIIFFIMICHFKKIATAVLLLACISLCIFGTAIGILIQGVDFSLTCTLGIISLMGILVRNGIIMIDYAEELRSVEKMSVKDAIYHSAKRRMRPIFLTSAAASMGVIPMILGGSSLWMPMGTVIFYGTILTMLFILTILPVAYWLIFSRSTEKRINRENFELQ